MCPAVSGQNPEPGQNLPVIILAGLLNQDRKSLYLRLFLV